MKFNIEGLKSFIPDATIEALLESEANAPASRIRDIIQKSLDKNRLEPAETAALLGVKDPELKEMIKEGAHTLKERIYGNRIVLFAPLYVGNECINDCVYCGFRISNKDCERKTLSHQDLVDETKALVDVGHKRLIMVYGEHPMYSPEYIAETVQTVYDTKFKNGEIRRVNINAAPMDVEGFRVVKAAGIGTYQIFQESYHQKTYEQLHPSGPKSSFLWRLDGLDRAMKAGIDDLGIGALMGLHDWRFEVMGLLYHTIHLEDTFGVGPHTISFPRIEPAIGTSFTDSPPDKVSDEDFKLLVAILRLSVPYTGMILTAREPVDVRNEVLRYGVSQIDAGSSIGVGDYSHKDDESRKKSQFVLGDTRSLDDVIYELTKGGYIPSFCTSCYRAGRTGEHFMEFAIPGFVKRFCTPNALLTFSEYLHDYSSERTLKAGLELVDFEVGRIEDPEMKKSVTAKLEEMKTGKRDLYY
ncbi:MAG: [FeFe] hydrogenase H-cluster radical SAM maturase HydG [Candidatus Cloacimonetes bacterium]|jgi:2-iminoacetate synthase|nr:[FeFe] hydrogenase H-cluster radical SAM maturase HydG [Candidatus Cloacimonadota bacterium]MCB5286229.1 [FeFe] hydrogenase H-cluster radical SAM maturase HydG [Candidatus Cloacimonadota bacterium]MCK9184217.1 [FeFe] hydrogenase H-cluster radical SAM maturase HydG [Candidatus Cloacimonadota bacterium]MCK9584047.1 [FeFe] hydrogenase H-cluster radical SAM maturase HydG [Candidatus Cloacimonadota bacterium]MDY0228551.1 [FeFe] hydrogenase H-cluster radical SAM maturase HydG [Candidatus Cloacimon